MDEKLLARPTPRPGLPHRHVGRNVIWLIFHADRRPFVTATP